MVAPDEQYPIVVGQTLAVPHIHILVRALLFKAETAVAHHDNQCIRHPVLHTALIDELREVPVYVATHHDTLRLRKIIYVRFFHFSICKNKNKLFLLFHWICMGKGGNVTGQRKKIYQSKYFFPILKKYVYLQANHK